MGKSRVKNNVQQRLSLGVVLFACAEAFLLILSRMCLSMLLGLFYLKSVTLSHNDETWHSYASPKEDWKNV